MKKWVMAAFSLALFFFSAGPRPLWAQPADVCGDFFVTGGEACDNGSQCEDGLTDCTFDASVCASIGSGTCAPRSGDGCLADCSAFEEGTGWYCVNFDVDFGFGPVTITFCQTQCGDGIAAGTEQCDDGNLTNGDGCDDATGFCVPSACGNFVIAGEEACDDGNTADDDGCSASCSVELGWVCDNSFGFSVCHTNCGDGLFAGQEQCEDGKQCDNGDDCTLDSSICGDGSCAARNGDGCDNDAANPDINKVGNCTFTGCGNGVETDGEDCDDGNNNDADFSSDFCDSNCTFPSCGNGVVDHIVLEDGFVFLDDECDDGNDINGDGCDNNCTLPRCGNSIIDPGEICDDGNAANDDGCSADCKPECGDGVKGVNEGCDDGNIRSGDGCSSVCTVEIPGGMCGNGVLDAGEECDDGNTAGGDGCEANCTDQSFESSNPTLIFDQLTEGDVVILNAPDPRGSSAALSMKAAVLPSDCDCTWSVVPSQLGFYSNAGECQTQLTLSTAGDGVISVTADCGAEGSGKFLQNLVVQPRPAESGGGCGLVR